MIVFIEAFPKLQNVLTYKKLLIIILDTKYKN